MKVIHEYRQLNEDRDEDEYTDNDELANALLDWLQNLVDENTTIDNNSDDDSIDEEFATYQALKDHFKHHCIGGKEGNKSTPRTVMYDFMTIGDYRRYEKKILKMISTPTISIYTFKNRGIQQRIKLILDTLPHTPCIVTFKESCGVKSNGKKVAVTFRAFANDVTTNYSGTTLDFCVHSKDKKTSTLFPIDSNKIIRQLNRTLDNYTENIKVRF